MAENPEKANKSRVQLHELEPNSVYSNHLNNSSSKMQYSMPRDPRFKEQKTKYPLIYAEANTSSTICPACSPSAPLGSATGRRWIWERQEPLRLRRTPTSSPASFR